MGRRGSAGSRLLSPGLRPGGAGERVRCVVGGHWLPEMRGDAGRPRLGEGCRAAGLRAVKGGVGGTLKFGFEQLFGRWWCSDKT